MLNKNNDPTADDMDYRIHSSHKRQGNKQEIKDISKQNKQSSLFIHSHRQIHHH
jgi:hypothetical protein